MKRALVYAHFNPLGRVEDYVFYALRQYRMVVDELVFVTTSPLPSSARLNFGPLVDHVLERKNEGYDFYSYREGLRLLNLDLYDEVIICNDSVMGPLVPLEPLLLKSSVRYADFWGVTISHEISRHIQSYFTLFRKPVLNSPVFGEFWRGVTVLQDKDEIVRLYEVGLSECLQEAGFSAGALLESTGGLAERMSTSKGLLHYLKILMRGILDPGFYSRLHHDIRNIKAINPSLDLWRGRLEAGELYFLKTSVVRQLYRNSEPFTALVNAVSRKSDYPTIYIENYARRHGGVGLAEEGEVKIRNQEREARRNDS